ncbi:hypothetical protein [Alkalibacillus silvisoli]|uniref:Lantibiotic n=1 Tax=Alkalibacillus silvisoli TaxID=392823 RepID=A0ABP3JS52_9BACI
MEGDNQFDLDLNVDLEPVDDVQPQTTVPCGQTIAWSIRYCTRVTCRGCF